MIPLIFVFLFICSCLHPSFAQTDQQRINDLDKISEGGHQQMIGKGQPPPEVIGSTYYSDHWLEGTVILYTGQMLENNHVRFDLARGAVEVRSSGKEFVFHEEEVKEFNWMDPYTGHTNYFINCRGFNINGTELAGFFEVIVDDEISLLSHPEIKIREPDYVPGLDVGSRDFEIRRKETYYLLFKTKELVDLSDGKKRIIRTLGKDYSRLKDFIKINHINFKDRADLIHIVTYLNSPNRFE